MRIRILLLVALSCILTADDQQTHLSPRFQTVYILSMANSLDQHLASRLTSNHVLWVVLQPSNADAVFTDSLDDEFWTWLEKTYPPPAGAAPSNRDTAYHSGSPSSSRQRGTVFLIDPRNRLVLWSTYELPKNSSPTELDRSATRISNQLKIAFGKK